MHGLVVLREQEAPTVEGRTIVARICTYGRTYEIAQGVFERVRAGAFKSPIARPAGLVRWRHMGNRPGDVDHPRNVHGSVRVLRESDGAVFADLRLFDDPDSDRLLDIVRTGRVGVSMGAEVSDAGYVTDPERGQVREIRRIRSLAEVSLTDTPAYDDAAVLALRERQEQERVAALAEHEQWLHEYGHLL